VSVTNSLIVRYTSKIHLELYPYFGMIYIAFVLGLPHRSLKLSACNLSIPVLLSVNKFKKIDRNALLTN